NQKRCDPSHQFLQRVRNISSQPRYREQDARSTMNRSQRDWYTSAGDECRLPNSLAWGIPAVENHHRQRGQMMKRILLLGITLFALAQTHAMAEITDSSASGFTYKTTVVLQAQPQTAYERFLEVGNWWSSDHTFSGDARNLSIEAKPMGCW